MTAGRVVVERGVAVERSKPSTPFGLVHAERILGLDVGSIPSGDLAIMDYGRSIMFGKCI